ncbi:MAG: OmpH family outer membrane protein [Saprospiraceae bacterium]|nr:OmpH family outer membrane protein [Saprospiraceae bacterium]
MMIFKKYVVTMAMVLLAFGSEAQQLKVGYINTQELILLMPEVKTANDSIQATRQRVEGRIKSMVDELRLKAVNLEKRKNDIAPVQYDKEVQLLEAEEKRSGNLNSSASRNLR